MILAQTVQEIYISETVGCGIFDRVLNFDNGQPEVISDVVSGMVDQDGVISSPSPLYLRSPGRDGSYQLRFG